MSYARSLRLAQEVADTYRRALIGGVFYLVGWLVVGIYGGAFSRAPLAAWAVVLGFVVLGTLRFVWRPAPNLDTPAHFAWLWRHWGLVIATCVLWGGVLAWAFSDPGFAPARTAALLSTIGLATAFAHTFSMRRRFAFTGIAFLYLPGLILLWRDPVDRASALVMSVYFIYVMLAMMRSHTDYQHHLDLDQGLRDQRDLFLRQSRIDALTELANRRHFADVLTEAWQRARDTGAPLALLVLDLDHFKTINDVHGHAVGDACLVAFAAKLQSAFSGKDELAARLGGEEFGVLLESHDVSAAYARAERFRAALVAQPIEVEGEVLPITVSIGVAEFDPAMHRNGDGLYRAADRAVYTAKTSGRNRVCRDEPAVA